MEAHSGTGNFLSYVRKTAIPILSGAQSWETLHRDLAQVGLSLRLKGNGLIVLDHTGTVAVKANTIAHDFSKAKMEKRFGAFAASNTLPKLANHPKQHMEKPQAAYQKTALSVDF
jgi:hypothetical protein